MAPSIRNVFRECGTSPFSHHMRIRRVRVRVWVSVTVMRKWTAPMNVLKWYVFMWSEWTGETDWLCTGWWRETARPIQQQKVCHWHAVLDRYSSDICRPRRKERNMGKHEGSNDTVTVDNHTTRLWYDNCITLLMIIASHYSLVCVLYGENNLVLSMISPWACMYVQMWLI